MILNLTHGFLFIHVPKAAGKSVERALGHLDERSPRTVSGRLRRRLNLATDPRRAYLKRHDTYSDVLSLAGHGIGNLYSFAVVRNPFDHARSHYEYMKEIPSRYAERARRSSFESFLEWRAVPSSVPRKVDPDRHFAKLPDQTHFLVGPDGRLGVRKVIRLERLQEGVDEVCAALRLPPVKVGRENVTAGRKDTVADGHYSPRAMDLVRQIYRRDFEAFGYDERF